MLNLLVQIQSHVQYSLECRKGTAVCELWAVHTDEMWLQAQVSWHLFSTLGIL